MARPDNSIEWATENVAEYVQNNEGKSVLVTNKTEPSTSFKLNGFLARKYVPRNYLNYILNSLGLYCKYNNEGEVGDCKIVASGTTKEEIEARYGNTWEDLGTDTLASQTFQVFRRIA